MIKEPDISDWVQGPADATAESGPVVSTMSKDALLLSRIILAQGEIAAAGSDPLQVVDMMTRRAQELTRSTGAVVEMRDGEDMLYWSASGIAEQHLGLRLPSGESLSGLCMRSGQVLQCDDSEQDPRVNLDACRKVGLRSMLVVPLSYGDRGIGVLKVMSPYPFS